MRVPVWQNSIAPGDQIDVERALPPAFYSFALCIFFDSVTFHQQVTRRDIRLKGDSRIHKIRPVWFDPRASKNFIFSPFPLPYCLRPQVSILTI